MIHGLSAANVSRIGWWRFGLSIEGPAEESGASASAPKAQPPRKRSGLKDRWVMTLWKAADGFSAERPPTEVTA